MTRINKLVTMIRSTLLLLFILFITNYGFSQKLKRMRSVNKGTITVTGVARDGKWCGVLLSKDSILYYLEDGVRWDEQFLNKTIEVEAFLILEKRSYKVDKNDNGEIVYSAVLPERMWILKTPSITILEN